MRKTAHNTAPYYRSFRPAPPTASAENNFIGGLKTEFTGLNFPENACTAVENCVFSVTGDVTRRGGINLELPSNAQVPVQTGGAFTTYHWRNAGSDGVSEFLIQQTGSLINFFQSSGGGGTGAGDNNEGISKAPTVFLDLNSFKPGTQTLNPGMVECQYADGNGILFIFNSLVSPIAVFFNPTTQNLFPTSIDLQIRDYQGVPDNLGVQGNPALLTVRPGSLSNEHEYNLLNQGWTTVGSGGWTASSTSIIGSITSNAFSIPSGTYAFNIGSVTGISNGDTFTLTGTVVLNRTTGGTPAFAVSLNGTVTSYANPTLTVSISNSFGPISPFTSIVSESWSFAKNDISDGQISTWFTAIGNYPSNADIWWEFKNTSNVFAPTTSSILNTSLPNTRAPAGHFIVKAFDLNRNAVSGNFLNISGVSTLKRPTTGAWFAGRIWYSGVDDSFSQSGDVGSYDWSENIYFSQVITDVSGSQFGLCFSQNDPTNENFFDPLSTDGGIISIPGSGAVQKLFPIANGLLVMAQNGIWLISGSAGYGFDATSYLVSKISEVKVITPSSIVNVLGLPIFWNQEGIYMVQQSQGNSPYGHGGLQVQPITVGTILGFYNNIPLDSKRHAQGSYNPITYVLQWVFRSTEESGIANRYVYDSGLSLNVYNKAFYPYTIATTPTNVTGIQYMDYTVGNLEPQFKYPCMTGSNLSFAEENDFTFFKDWTNQDYTSTFTTGYKLHGGAFRKWQPIYLYMYSRNLEPSSYTVQAIWDFNTNALGRSSILQTINTFNPKFGMIFRRHKLRGHGLVVQFKINSVSGQPFDFMGWAIPESSAVGA